MKRDWPQLIESHARSGLSVREFCKLHGVAESHFYSKRRPQIQRSRFSEVIVKEDPLQKELELVLRCDANNRFHFHGSTTDPGLFRLIFERGHYEKSV